MQAIGPAPATLSPEDFLSVYGEAGGPLDELVMAARDPENEEERLSQIRKARRNWRFVQGDQFITAGWANEAHDFVDFVDVGAPGAGQPQMEPHAFNFLWADCSKFVAVMGQSSPRVKAAADDPGVADDLRSAVDADAVLRDCWKKLQVDRLWRTIAFHQYVTGPTFLHTPYVTDRMKYGESVEPRVRLTEVPQPDGSIRQRPVQDGVETYPNGDVELHVATVLEVSGPFGKKTLEEWGWLRYEYMESKYKLLSTFPEKLNEYRATDVPDDDLGASQTSATEAADAVGNPTGMGRTKKRSDWRHQQLWFRPWMYEAITSADAREVFQRQFPDGLYLAKVGNVKVAVDGRPLLAEWLVCKTGRGEKIFEDPICSNSVPIQRALNDLLNLAIETVLRAIAKTIVDQMLLDRKSASENPALPAEMIFTTTPLGTDISKMIAQIPPARLSDQVVPLIELFRRLDQDISGIRPEISGGGAPTQTYREAKQRKDQALMQLSPQAAEMQYASERLGENLVRRLAKYGSGTIKAQRRTAFGSRSDVVSLAQLADTGWHCESDDNFPMTAADTFDKLYGLLKEFSPEVAAQLSILSPMNLERVLAILQLPGFESSFEDQKQKTLGDIEQLMQGEPIPGPPGPDGQPGPPQPSIPVDQYDDHQFVSDFLALWMRSEDGRDARAADPPGFDNVEAFRMAHLQLAQPPQPPPPPPPARTAINVSGSPQEFGAEVVSQIMKGASLPGVPALPPPPPGTPPEQNTAAPPVDEIEEAPLGPLEGPDIPGPPPLIQ